MYAEGAGMFGNRISSAIAAYLAYGRASFPQQDDVALQRMFGVARSASLVEQMSVLLAEAANHEGHLNGDLAAFGQIVKSTMKMRHPKLTRKAVAALALYATFQWR